MDPKTQKPIEEVQTPPPPPNQPGEPEVLQEASNRNSTLKYVVLGLFVATVFVLILGVGYYFLMGNKASYNSSNQTTSYVSPATSPTPSPITAVYNSDDLTNLMTELERADTSLDSELSSLNKDSNF